MKLKSQVITLQQAKRLKELGVKQESLFYISDNGVMYVNELIKLFEDGLVDEVIEKNRNEEGRSEAYVNKEKLNKAAIQVFAAMKESKEKEVQVFAAFTVAELGAMLPHPDNISEIGCFPHLTECDISAKDGHWYCLLETPNEKHGGYNREIISGDTEAEARAAMLIFLLENNLITHQDINNKL